MKRPMTTADIMPEEIPELLSYMEDVMPKKKNRFNQQDQVLDAYIEADDYLPVRG